MMCAGCFLAGTKVALIVEVDAVGDGIEAACCAQSFHQGEEFILAEEAALRIVANVLRAVEFRSCDHFQRNGLLLRKGNRVGKLGACQAGGVGNDRQHVVPERLMCGPSQVGGIHAAGIGDEQTSQLTEVSL